MIATEAAAEGINLQFCSLVINYDLPWNPQRIEQRIGRCHRYGQKHDVVVVNFLNKKNAADQRVYQLLDEKFKLFSGVFGASDEVLGSIESGIDFEKRIANIYQKCRTEEQIQLNFDQLQQEMEIQIDDRIEQTRQKLLENFDEEVHEKLRVNLKESNEVLSKYDGWLWQLTRFYLAPYAKFEDDLNGFTLMENPFPAEQIHRGPYRSGKNAEDVNLYRLGHPLAQKIIDRCKQLATEVKELDFHYTGSGKKISILEPLMGRSGFMTVTALTAKSLDMEDHILLGAVCDDGGPLFPEQSQRLFSLEARERPLSTTIEFDRLKPLIDQQLKSQANKVVQRLTDRNASVFEMELDKLDRWGEDQRNSLRVALRELEDKIKAVKKAARLAPNLPEKLKLEREKRQLESKRDEAWKEYEQAAKDIEDRKDTLMDEIEKRMNQILSEETLFTIRWKVQ
jgi:hypothetical protein